MRDELGRFSRDEMGRDGTGRDGTNKSYNITEKDILKVYGKFRKNK